MSDQADARAVIDEYVAASAARDVDRLKSIFHPQALMSGYLGDQSLIGSPQPFFDAVQHAPPGAKNGYRAEITQIEVTGRVASATLKEQNFLGMNFTDYFHLAKLGGRWTIVSKTFSTE